MNVNYQKILKLLLIISIIINLVNYMIFGNIARTKLHQGGIQIDFYDAFIPAVQRFLENPALLYQVTDLPFRYLPESIYYLMLFYFITPDFEFNAISCTILIFMINITCCIMIVKITNLDAFKAERGHGKIDFVPFLLASYLMTPAQSVEYIQVQVNIITNLFVIICVYYSLKGNENLSLLFLGCGAVFKITVLLFAPFVFFENIQKNFFKKSILRAFFLITPLIPSILMFMLIKGCLENFMAINLHANSVMNGTFALGNTSLTKFVSTVFNTDATLTFFVIAAVMYSIAGYLLLKCKIGKINRYMLGAFTMMMLMPDFYGLHFMFIWGIMILWLLVQPGKLGWKYKVVFFSITVSYLGWLRNPLSSMVMLAFYMTFVWDIIKINTACQINENWRKMNILSSKNIYSHEKPIEDVAEQDH